MARRHHYKSDEQVELDITTFLNLMVVLIPFLLVTAVFSQMTIHELNLPSQAAGGEKPDKPLVNIEVMVRKDKLEVVEDKDVVTIDKIDDKHDTKKLTEVLKGLHAKYPEKKDANLLVEPDIEYEVIIQVMDAIKTFKVSKVGADGQEKSETVALFPELSLGDAP